MEGVRGGVNGVLNNGGDGFSFCTVPGDTSNIDP